MSFSQEIMQIVGHDIRQNAYSCIPTYQKYLKTFTEKEHIYCIERLSWKPAFKISTIRAQTDH